MIWLCLLQEAMPVLAKWPTERGFNLDVVAELVLCISTYTSPSFMDAVSPGGCRRVQRGYRSRLDSLGNSLSFDYARYYQHAFAYCGASYICYTDLSSELLIKRVHPAKSALQGLTVNYISARPDYVTMVS